ncbi:hypothetical protein OG559_04870 [Micromonospora sp. NBC_01405]|uniref:hypothetical protein n=1 Tax=Micromonospora sp. NBC_01405 TaxID=2903589 RepID=UPI0032470215
MTETTRRDGTGTDGWSTGDDSVGAPFDFAGGTRDLHEALRQIQEELTGGDTPLDFGRQGAAELLKTNTRLIREIGIRAIRIARLRGLETVSKIHIDVATKELIRTDGDTRRTSALAFGGAFLGAGIQELITFCFTPASPKGRVLVMMTCLVVGAGLLVYGLDLRRKN